MLLNDDKDDIKVTINGSSFIVESYTAAKEAVYDKIREGILDSAVIHINDKKAYAINMNKENKGKRTFVYDTVPSSERNVTMVNYQLFQNVDEKANNYSSCYDWEQILDDTKNNIIRFEKMRSWDGSIDNRDVYYYEIPEGPHLINAEKFVAEYNGSVDDMKRALKTFSSKPLKSSLRVKMIAILLKRKLNSMEKKMKIIMKQGLQQRMK